MSDDTTGSRHGWDPSPAQPPTWGAPPEGPTAAPTGPAGPPPAAGEVLPAYAAPEPRRSRPGTVVAVGVGIAAALVAAVFAVTSFGGSDGSPTPEAAVERLFDALSDQDVIGLLESLPPGERSAVLPGIRGVASELQRLRLLSDDLDLANLSGIDFQVDGLELASEPLGPGIAAVRITAGTITSTFDPPSLPLGENLEALLAMAEIDLAEVEPDVSTEDLATDDAHLVVIEERGGWHVSLFYSIAEAARRDALLPLPAFGAGVTPAGAPSPEAVVEELAAAAIRLDARRAIALLAPDEMRALHDYAPLFLDEVEAERDELLATGEVAITLDRLDLDREGDGDTARVIVRGFAFSGTVDGEEGWADFDGDCLRYSDGDIEEESCISDAEDLDIDLSDVTFAFTVVQRDGEWFLSPVRTSFDLTTAALSLLDPADFDGEDSTFGQLIEMFFFGAFMGVSGTESSFEEVWESEPLMGHPETDWYDDEYGDGYDDGYEVDEYDADLAPGSGSTRAEEEAAVEECYGPVDDLPPGASEEEHQAAWAEVEECFAGR
ncbi:MAG TPA: hypothetical protein VMN58_07900 [Acidimicrobiales bacterium]|nr:hypothetical protein [Acidimicrobiales bacterium]